MYTKLKMEIIEFFGFRYDLVNIGYNNITG